MNVWFRSTALASGALLVAAIHTGAQIREGVSGPVPERQRSGLVQRRGHPQVLLHTRGPEFEGGERVIQYLLFKHLDPKEAVGKLSPPAGIDGLIAYSGSKLLVIRGTKEAVAGYRSSLERLDRAAPEPPSPAPVAVAGRPEIVVSAREKLNLNADKVSQDGSVTRATGQVVIRLGDGIELTAQQVRIVSEGGKQRIVIEK
jgi:hypothetical protein